MALFGNYRRLVSCEDPCATSFTVLLRHVAADPVLLLLFLCYDLEQIVRHLALRMMKKGSPPSTSDQCRGPRGPYNASLLKLMKRVHQVVTHESWQDRRLILLALYQYPISSTKRISLTLSRQSRSTAANVSKSNHINAELHSTPCLPFSSETIAWAHKFTDSFSSSYVELSLTHTSLSRWLGDDHYMLFVIVYHHAAVGRMKQLVQSSFRAIPQSLLYAAFDVGHLSSDMKAPRGAYYSQVVDTGHHFVGFLFHPDLKGDESSFLALLDAFKQEDAQNCLTDHFFRLYLIEVQYHSTVQYVIMLLYST